MRLLEFGHRMSTPRRPVDGPWALGTRVTWADTRERDYAIVKFSTIT